MRMTREADPETAESCYLSCNEAVVDFNSITTVCPFEDGSVTIVVKDKGTITRLTLEEHELAGFRLLYEKAATYRVDKRAAFLNLIKTKIVE